MPLCNSCTDGSTCDDWDVGYYFDDTIPAVLPCMTHCTSCTTATFCDGSCGTGFWLEVITAGTVNQCSSCLDNCDVCVDDITCTTCASTFNKITVTGYDICSLLNCLEGFFFDDPDCVDCDVSHCKLCAAIDSCEECFEPYFLKTIVPPTECVLACGDDYYPESATAATVD